MTTKLEICPLCNHNAEQAFVYSAYSSFSITRCSGRCGLVAFTPDQWNANAKQIAKTKSQLSRAEALLNSCLEWDNGGERDYQKICDLINEIKE